MPSYCIVSEEDGRATATADIRKFVKFGHAVFEMCEQVDKQAHIQSVDSDILASRLRHTDLSTSSVPTRDEVGLISVVHGLRASGGREAEEAWSTRGTSLAGDRLLARTRARLVALRPAATFPVTAARGTASAGHESERAVLTERAVRVGGRVVAGQLGGTCHARQARALTGHDVAHRAPRANTVTLARCRQHTDTEIDMGWVHPWVGLAAWRSIVISGVRRVNEVNARRARLVLRWVTVFGRVGLYHFGM